MDAIPASPGCARSRQDCPLRRQRQAGRNGRPPPGDRPADYLPYGVDTIVIPFTWSGPQRRRLPWRRFGGNKGVTGPGPYPPRYVGQSAAIAERNFARALRDAQQTSTELAPSALQTLRGSSHNFYPHDAGTAAAAGATAPSTQAVRIKAAADAGLSGGSGADGGWGSSASNTEGFGATAPDQASAILASSPLSGASPPTDAGTAATADAGAAAAGVDKPNDPTAPVPVFDDQGRPVLIPAGPDKGKQMLRPARLDPHFLINQGTADRSYYDALTHSPVSDNGGADLAILSLELMQLYKLKQGGEWDAQRAGGKNYPDYVDYATVAIGLYAASSGIPRDEILRAQDAYAARYSRYPPDTVMDKTYTHLPFRNVANTDLGFQLYRSGGIHAAAGP